MKRLVRPILATALAGCILGSCGGETGTSLAPVPTGGPIIIISIDTLRADRLPAWGYDRIETPAIDGLIRDGIRFSSAWSHVPLTLPAHASIFTGLLPGEHGVRDNLGYRLDPEAETLATLLDRSGYATAGMVSAWVLREDSGIAQGFDTWDDQLDPRPGVAVGELQRNGQATVDAAASWLRQREDDEPFFLFVHLFEPHSPYEPPEPFRSRYSDRYDGEIAAADAIVERFLSSLRASDMYERSTIILLSDHGEGLNDHGEQEHGIFLYRETIHVPLVIKLPGSHMAGTTVDEPVQLIDVYPTVLQIAGVAGAPGRRGSSLVDIAVGGVEPEGRRVFSESMYPRLHFGWSELTSLTDGETHVIQAPRPELYDLEDDPAETTNLVEQERRLYAEFLDEIETVATPFAPPSVVDPEAAAKLTALGYLGSGPSSSDGPRPDPKDRIGELRRMKDAWQDLQEGRNREAVRKYESVVEDNPELTDAWIQLSMAYEAVGSWTDAIAAAKQAIRISPSVAQGVAITIARLHLRLGDLDEAEKHALLAAPVSPEEASLIRARVELTRGNLEESAAIASELMDDERFRAQAAVVVAQTRIKRGEFQQALELLERERERLSADGLPPPSLMEFARADALVRLGRVEEGMAAFRSEIAHHPGDLHAYSRLAALHVLSGGPDEAERVIEQMVRNNPGPESESLAVRTFERLGRNDLAARWSRGPRSGGGR